jgi:UDP-N-acetylmuramate: L-alanyl-gamma-D-glutamyl-meso-diaminopimelate ligase
MSHTLSSAQPFPSRPLHFHLMGIGGTFMGSLAGLLRAAGHAVTGSDENVYPPMSDQLHSLGIAYSEGFRPGNVGLGENPSLERPDVVVVGNAISRGNPELEAVLDAKIPYTSGAAVVKEEFIRGRVSLAVAGTHGKTTTTSLLAWSLECAGLEPSFLIGGVAENFGTSFRLTDSPILVIEADEYDTAYFDKGPKMWHYLPDVAIINNIEFDHADIYRDEIAYRFAFERFINLIPSRGTLVAGWDSPIVRDLAPRSFAPVESFGYDEPPAAEAPRWTAGGVEFGTHETRFSVFHDGTRWGEVVTPLAGAFSVRNCLAVIAASVAAGAEREGILRGLATFRSVKRRMEVRGEVRGVTVIDDFAHHPTAVRETLRATRQRYAGRRIVAIFEPRSYTAQRHDFERPFIEALGAADKVVMAGLFHPERYTAETAIDPERMVDAWRAAGLEADHIPEPDDIVRRITPLLGEGDVVLVMSNGGFGGIHGKLLGALEATDAETPRDQPDR